MDPIAALLIDKRRSDRQGSETATGVMKARQNQQQGQCKGQGRQQTEKISKGRQGQNRETHLGKCSEMSDGAKQDFAMFAWKCAA